MTRGVAADDPLIDSANSVPLLSPNDTVDSGSLINDSSSCNACSIYVSSQLVIRLQSDRCSFTYVNELNEATLKDFLLLYV